jgi:beta-galactosidase
MTQIKINFPCFFPNYFKFWNLTMIYEQKFNFMFIFVSAIRRVISRYSSIPLPSIPSDNEKTSYGPIHLQRQNSLFDMFDFTNSSKAFESENPMSMENVGQVCYCCSCWCKFPNWYIIEVWSVCVPQIFGFLLYVTEYKARSGRRILFIPKVLFEYFH